MSQPEPYQKKTRINEMLRAAAEVLRDKPDGLPGGEVIAAVKEAVPPTEPELTRNKSGYVRYDTNLRFWTIDLVKSGWVRKEGGRWYLTEDGARALIDYPDPQDFGKAANAGYRAWKQREAEAKQARSEWELVDSVVARIPIGRWATFTDLAEATDRYHAQVGSHLWSDTPPGWHRVARQGGVLSAEVYGDETRVDEQRMLLAGEGFDTAGPLPPERRLSAAELAGLVAEAKGGDRAWLVRGTSVRGASIVGEWLEGGYVSLPASMLPPIDVSAEDQAIRTAVDSGYSTLGYSQREAKYEEVRAFLRRMRPGDVVLTTSGDEVFTGEVTGGATQVESAGRRSNLRRPVDWDNADSPLAVGDLPSRLHGRLSATADLVELTDLIDEVRALQVPEEPGEIVDPSPGTAAELPDLPNDVIDRLLIGREWLVEFVELLRDRRQVILYGPPGTGKTFLAQEVAEALAGKGNVTLVQFHPSYAYEDFFEGYRPAPGAGGGVALQLVPGPFRKVVDLARANPAEPYVLIVDEINRANLAKVFGELYFLLEYRDRTIDLLYSSGDSGPAFSLPANVYIIGTMNTADRSIALVDAAMRRRFAFLSLHPEDQRLDEVLRAWLADRSLPEDVADLLVELNKRIQDKDVKIGPSYLMNASVATDAGLDRIWRTSILPLLEEYHVGDGIDVTRKYGLEALRAALAPAEPSE